MTKATDVRVTHDTDGNITAIDGISLIFPERQWYGATVDGAAIHSFDGDYDLASGPRGPMSLSIQREEGTVCFQEEIPPSENDSSDATYAGPMRIWPQEDPPIDMCGDRRCSNQCLDAAIRSKADDHRRHVSAACATCRNA